ncbi:porin family protein [Chryseobacterium sp. CH21]|uniref:porin family protein n=1 Tax=Chryseobacterium sp. CH21 TaxID=713556 RepID=UPI0013E963A2|nr:porin family protein [Chryseobacterium sp. CH21]
MFAQKVKENTEIKEVNSIFSKFDVRVTVGFNLGGLSPIPLPSNIRKVKSYNPTFAPSVGAEIKYNFHKKWSVGINPRLDYKGMKVKDSVVYFHTLIQQGSGNDTATFEGAFSGTNETESKNLYLGAPVFVEFTPGKNWHYRLGGYMAFLLKGKFEGTVSDGYIRNGGSLGEKVEISSASFDFSDKIRKTDYGFYAGARRSFGNHWSADVSLQWGLRSTFPSSFTGISFPMYNIFAQIGAGYQF